MKPKTRQALIKSFIDFYTSNKHKEIPNSSLVPLNDPTVLFTTAGMHPLVPYLLGQPHPLKTKRLVNVQKCIRTVDIDEVGDPYHHTFFEMLGKWSLGDYFKEGAIKYTFDFLTKVLKLPIEKLAVSCFKGWDEGSTKVPKDTESAKVWESLGFPKERIAFLPKSENWWGPAGETGPCGPDTEIFFWSSPTLKAPKKFSPNDRNWVEIGNDVLMQYNKTSSGEFLPLSQKNVDFGGGVERTLAVLNGFNDNYLSPTFHPIIKSIETISKNPYKSNEKQMRIIADHIKASVMIIADGISPSNTEQGYVLRRLIRRAIRYGKLLGIDKPFISQVAKSVFPIYPDYKELEKNQSQILSELETEESRFSQTLEKGLKVFQKLSTDKKLSGKESFLLFQSYGFPIEMTQELAKENKIKVDLPAFEKELKKHQSLSRTASAGVFKSGLADSSEKTTRLHTATHLLNEALRVVLKDSQIKQKGSNINPERLRFDFNFPRKLEPSELKAIETEVNKKIKASLNVSREEMPLKKALSSGAQAEFGAKYPEVVSVYTISDSSKKIGFFSKEICTGPHVTNTKEIGTFKIIKEESVAAGIRRIKATVN